MELLIAAVVGFVNSFVLERLKDSRWFPFMDWVSEHRNKVTPIIVAIATAAGITFTYDEVNGALTIEGLLPSEMLRAVVAALTVWITQQATYHKLVK